MSPNSCSGSSKSHGVNMFHRPTNTLRQQLVNPKDPTDVQQRCGTVYLLECPHCDASYIGETGRALGTRVKEHLSLKTNSAVGDHTKDTGHRFRADRVRILDREGIWQRRRIKEAISIWRHAPTLNRDDGLDLPYIYQQVLSRDNRSSRDRRQRH